MRIRVLVAVLAAMISVDAGAQWYLYKGNEARQEAPQAVEEPVKADSSSVGRVFVPDIPDIINATLCLPLGSTAEMPNPGFMEFYFGAMLAAADLGGEGLRINLKVIDSSDQSTPLKQSDIKASDVFIGPVSVSDIRNALALCPEGSHIISPLDPKAAGMTEGQPLIQAPATKKSQIEELVNWLESEKRYVDKVVVIKDPADSSDVQKFLEEKLTERNITHIVQSPSYINCSEAPFSTWRYITVCEKEETMSHIISAISGLWNKGREVALYTTSKARSADNADVTAMNKAETRLTTAYHVDYSNSKVKEFILKYRALYDAEPGQFAFCGYDTFHCFVKACATWGRNWTEVLDRIDEKGLQSDFRFKSPASPGATSCGARRVLYSRDLSTTLQ